MSRMDRLRDIENGDPVDAADPQFNFQTIENFIASDVTTVDGAKGFTGPVAGVAGSNPSHLATVAQVEAATPVGTVSMFAGQVVPSGWAWCRGAAVSKTDPLYAALFAVIGTLFGSDDSNNFNLPDLRDRSPLGSDGVVALGEEAGRNDWAVVSHLHTIGKHTHSVPAHKHEKGTLKVPEHTHSINHNHGAANTSKDGAHAHDTIENNYGADGSVAGWVNAPGWVQLNGLTTRGGDQGYERGVTSKGSAHTHSFTIPNFTGTSGKQLETAVTGSTADKAAFNTAESGSDNTGSTGDDATVNQNYHPVLGINFIIKL